MIARTIKFFIGKYSKTLLIAGVVVGLGALGFSYYKVYQFGQNSILAKQTEVISEYERKLAERQRALDSRKSERVRELEERVREIRNSTDTCANSPIPDDIMRNLD